MHQEWGFRAFLRKSQQTNLIDSKTTSNGKIKNEQFLKLRWGSWTQEKSSTEEVWTDLSLPVLIIIFSKRVPRKSPPDLKVTRALFFRKTTPDLPFVRNRTRSLKELPATERKVFRLFAMSAHFLVFGATLDSFDTLDLERFIVRARVGVPGADLQASSSRACIIQLVPAQVTVYLLIRFWRAWITSSHWLEIRGEPAFL